MRHRGLLLHNNPETEKTQPYTVHAHFFKAAPTCFIYLDDKHTAQSFNVTYPILKSDFKQMEILK
jgi:hypothetical protein